MSKATYPKYRASQWLDTSDDASADAVGTILYGIQIQRLPHGQWQHVREGKDALLFKTVDEVSARIATLKAQGEQA